MKMRYIVSALALLFPVWAHASEDGTRSGYQEGFFIESSEGDYRLQIQGFIQPRFTYNALKSTNDNTSVGIQKGELRLMGNVFSKTLKYKLQMNLATRAATTTSAVCANAGCTTTVNAVTSQTTSGLATLDDAFLDWTPIKEFGIRAGQLKVPFLAQELPSNDRVHLVDRSLAHSIFTLSRDIGATLHGDMFGGKMTYWAFGMNGDGVNTINRNKNYMVGARLEFPIMGKWTYSGGDVEYSEKPQLGVGVAYLHNKFGAAAQGGTIAAGTRASNATADAYFKYRGFSLHGAGVYSRTHTGATVTNWGFLGEAGYFVIPKRFETVIGASGAIFRGATPNQYEYIFGLNYHVKGHQVKLQTDFALQRGVRGGGLNDQRVRTQASVLF